ncbi:hypothetical protein NRIC_16160 [Enterococcus florum]|uniref:DUF3267 domain-containing protein n=1 Tax=Enterococcus florum TaxID=2480627 RepID=A0A4P5P6Z9_9ENTE|nr:DUF3267 domain-containing protein [Enterococcus florum]GCF93725.1 hypothetical protein NRIC_16160 [Enterococcus florum]
MSKFEKYEQTCEKMKQQNYHQEDHILSMVYCNTMGLLFPLPPLLFVGIVYYLRWGSFSLAISPVGFIIGLFATVIIHELLHGLAWSRFCEDGFSDVRFGINQGMPYCHCTQPLEKKHYLIGALTPVFVLGTLLFAASLIFPNSTLFALTMINILLAGGDMIIAGRVLRLSEAAIIDHPNLPGFVAFTKKESTASPN